MPKKKAKSGKPQVHDDLQGFELNINEFGEIISNMDIEQLNAFLNKNVKDKKLKDREDLDVVRDEVDLNDTAESEEEVLFLEEETLDIDEDFDESVDSKENDEDY